MEVTYKLKTDIGCHPDVLARLCGINSTIIQTDNDKLMDIEIIIRAGSGLKKTFVVPSLHTVEILTVDIHKLRDVVIAHRHIFISED